MPESQERSGTQRSTTTASAQRGISSNPATPTYTHRGVSALDQEGIFSAYEVFSLKIGEESGRISEVLLDLTNYFSKKIKQKRQMVQAFSYPAAVTWTGYVSLVKKTDAGYVVKASFKWVFSIHDNKFVSQNLEFNTPIDKNSALYKQHINDVSNFKPQNR